MYFCQKDKTMDSSGNGYWQERPTDIVRDRLEGRREAEAASNVTTVYDSVVKRQQKDGAEAKQAEKRQKTRNLIQGISGGLTSAINLYFTSQYAPSSYKPMQFAKQTPTGQNHVQTAEEASKERKAALAEDIMREKYESLVRSRHDYVDLSDAAGGQTKIKRSDWENDSYINQLYDTVWDNILSSGDKSLIDIVDTANNTLIGSEFVIKTKDGKEERWHYPGIKTPKERADYKRHILRLLLTYSPTANETDETRINVGGISSRGFIRDAISKFNENFK